MDINSISLPWQTFLAYGSAIITITVIIAYLRFRVEAVEKNDKRQDTDICQLKTTTNTLERNLALILQRQDMTIKQLELLNDRK